MCTFMLVILALLVLLLVIMSVVYSLLYYVLSVPIDSFYLSGHAVYPSGHAVYPSGHAAYLSGHAVYLLGHAAYLSVQGRRSSGHQYKRRRSGAQTRIASPARHPMRQTGSRLGAWGRCASSESRVPSLRASSNRRPTSARPHPALWARGGAVWQGQCSSTARTVGGSHRAPGYSQVEPA